MTDIAGPAPLPVIAAIPPGWRRPLGALALCWGLLVLLFIGDWAAMARQWWDSSTYTHILLVPPIIGWLVRLRWDQLRLLHAHAWWPGLMALAVALLLWLLGTLAGLNLASQAGAVAMLPAGVLCLLGPRVAAALAFPLAYMAFLVPFGDELVPTLQMITARLTIALTHASGIPAVIDGVFIDTPAGLFEVAEACSGVKFLIAMIALGALVAHVCFRNWWRRAAFMLAAIVIPILANGVRAWGSIFIAQYHGVEFAAGFDHILYGWVFFALVIAVLLGIGWRFFDRPAADPFVDAAALAANPWLSRMARQRLSPYVALAVATALALGTALWGRAALALEAPLPAQVALPDVPGWTRTAYAPSVPWEPRAAGAQDRRIVRYVDGGGRKVDLFVALYARQGEGSEAGAFGEGALVPGSAWRWLAPAPSLAGGDGAWLQADGRHRRLAVTFYRSGKVLTGSRARLKLATMQAQLAMRPQVTAMVIVSAEGAPDVAEGAVQAFLADSAPLGRLIDRIGGGA